MIRFRDFMEEAVRRYYTSSREKFAAGGDFFTAPELDPLFGEAVAEFLLPYIKEMEKPVLLELGAGRGLMARDILSYYRNHHPRLFARLRYRIYEISPFLRKVQGRILWEFDCVSWVEDLEPLEGVVLSNEFFDALPVHVVQGDRELYLRGEEEVWMPLRDPRLREFLRKMGYKELKQRIEVPLDALRILEKVSLALRRGYHLVIDYGYTSEELVNFPRGTIALYKKHRLRSDIYSCRGDADMSAHVNFSALIAYGREFGLETVFLKKQRDFLMGVPRFLEEIQRLASLEDPSSIERFSRIKIMLISMGDRFRVLFQRKEL